MATLTAADITWLRAMSGDDCEPYEVSDALMQVLYDDAESDKPTSVAYILRVRVARAAKLVSQSNSASSESHSFNQKFEHLMRLLKEWELRAGVAGSKLSIGSLSLNIDQLDDDGDDNTLYDWDFL
jgi:hypothetical protein